MYLVFTELCLYKLIPKRLGFVTLKLWLKCKCYQKYYTSNAIDWISNSKPTFQFFERGEKEQLSPFKSKAELGQRNT